VSKPVITLPNKPAIVVLHLDDRFGAVLGTEQFIDLREMDLLNARLVHIPGLFPSEEIP
jgi:hypothetical protein